MQPTNFNKLIETVQSRNIFTKCMPDEKEFIPKYINNKFIEFLSPDSKLYHSSLNPTFSFELELSSSEFIKSMNCFSLRDGVLTLLRFFILNPIPNSDFPTLVVDTDLSSLVPEEWRSRTLLRSFYSKKESDNKSIPLLIFISPTEEGCPVDLLNSELLKIKNLISSDTEIYILFSTLRLRGEGSAEFDTSFGYKSLKFLMDVFDFHKITILNWSEYLKLDISNFKYYQINPLLYYFTDSYLLHDANARGAIPLVKNLKNSTTDYHFDLSINHGFILHQNFRPHHFINFNELQIENEVCAFNRSATHQSLKFASDNLKAIAHDISYQLRANRCQEFEH